MVVSLILSGFIIGIILLYVDASRENTRLSEMARKIAERQEHKND